MRPFIALVTLLAVGLPATGRAQDSTLTTRWAWRVPDGRWINVRNLNGRVDVHQGSGDSVVVTATKRVYRGDASYVSYAVQRYGDGDQDVLVCALWGSNADCSPTGYDSDRDDRDSRRNRISVTFDVAVPAGVRVSAHTVNEGVSVTGATSEVVAGTVNGGVTVETDGGPVSANTVNGSVHVTMLHYQPTRDMRFSSVNGSVVVEFGGNIDADIDLQTVNGRFVSDFPVTLNGRIDPRHLRATLGKGGPTIRIRTVNGNVELRKH
jgi:hypothetical protein